MNTTTIQPQLHPTPPTTFPYPILGKEEAKGDGYRQITTTYKGAIEKKLLERELAGLTARGVDAAAVMVRGGAQIWRR